MIIYTDNKNFYYFVDNHTILIQWVPCPYEEDDLESNYYNAVIFKDNSKVHHTNPIKENWKQSLQEALKLI